MTANSCWTCATLVIRQVAFSLRPMLAAVQCECYLNRAFLLWQFSVDRLQTRLFQRAYVRLRIHSVDVFTFPGPAQRCRRSMEGRDVSHSHVGSTPVAEDYLVIHKNIQRKRIVNLRLLVPICSLTSHRITDRQTDRQTYIRWCVTGRYCWSATCLL